MNTQTNPLVKKVIQKTFDSLIKTKKYQNIKKVDVFFCFGSSYKTAMCQYVYGIKVYSDIPLSLRNNLLLELQLDIKRFLEKTINVNACATDVIFNS